MSNFDHHSEARSYQGRMSDTKPAADQVRTAVIEGYLETGKALDIKEIATRLEWSESKVRRVIADAHGCVDGLQTWQEHRESYSRNYRGITSGAHKAWVYSPSSETLRGMINELRASGVPKS
jgi:hypothetical protein